jgi:hypothetical protein
MASSNRRRWPTECPVGELAAAVRVWTALRLRGRERCRAIVPRSASNPTIWMQDGVGAIEFRCDDASVRRKFTRYGPGKWRIPDKGRHSLSPNTATRTVRSENREGAHDPSASRTHGRGDIGHDIGHAPIRLGSVDSPPTMSILEEATLSSEAPLMGVFNNLISAATGAGNRSPRTGAATM